jgi:hypothetical protein
MLYPTFQEADNAGFLCKQLLYDVFSRSCTGKLLTEPEQVAGKKPDGVVSAHIIGGRRSIVGRDYGSGITLPELGCGLAE